MDKNYKNLVFTTHALEKLSKRSIGMADVWQVINHPHKKFAQKDGGTKFIKTIAERRMQVVATFLPKERKWLVVSVWVRGEADKLPIMWQIIVLPFKIGWWLIKAGWRVIKR